MAAPMQWCMAMTRRLMMTQRTASCSEGIIISTGMEVCGRGDKKTKKGKRFKGTYGNARGKKQKMIERIKDKLELPRSTPWPLPFKLI
ncbi:unnamed protein product [Cochlearia groenlandica]